MRVRVAVGMTFGGRRLPWRRRLQGRYRGLISRLAIRAIIADFNLNSRLADAELLLEIGLDLVESDLGPSGVANPRMQGEAGGFRVICQIRMSCTS